MEGRGGGQQQQRTGRTAVWQDWFSVGNIRILQQVFSPTSPLGHFEVDNDQQVFKVRGRTRALGRENTRAHQRHAIRPPRQSFGVPWQLLLSCARERKVQKHYACCVYRVYSIIVDLSTSLGYDPPTAVSEAGMTYRSLVPTCQGMTSAFKAQSRQTGDAPYLTFPMPVPWRRFYLSWAFMIVHGLSWGCHRRPWDCPWDTNVSWPCISLSWQGHGYAMGCDTSRHGTFISLPWCCHETAMGL